MEQFLGQIIRYPDLGLAVRTLIIDIPPQNSHTASVLTRKIRAILEHTPLIRHVRFHRRFFNQLIDGPAGREFLEKLFCGLPHLEALELSGCDTWLFGQKCLATIDRELKMTQSLRDINLAGCINLPARCFSLLLSQSPALQYLNVSNTGITSSDLARIPPSARLIYLNISCCRSMDAGLVNFLTRHSSTKVLEQLLFEQPLVGDRQQHNIWYPNEQDISLILASLPATLKTLDLSGSAMDSSHLPLLKVLSLQLHELSIGYGLQLSEVEKIFFDSSILDSEDIGDDSDSSGICVEEDNKLSSRMVLNPMEEAIAVCKLRTRVNSVPEPSTKRSTLRYLDISCVSLSQQRAIKISVLLGPQSAPLNTIVLADSLPHTSFLSSRVFGALGWEIRHSRSWLWLTRKTPR